MGICCSHSAKTDMNSMLSLHTHSMLLSTRANGTKTVQSNLYNGFEDMARKMLHYCKHVSRGSRPTDQVISSGLVRGKPDKY